MCLAICVGFWTVDLKIIINSHTSVPCLLRLQICGPVHSSAGALWEINHTLKH